MGVIVLPLQCILVKILVCMISLKSGGGGGAQHLVPPCFLPPCLGTLYDCFIWVWCFHSGMVSLFGYGVFIQVWSPYLGMVFSFEYGLLI